MACAVGAAGMAITIHGSLAEAWTPWTYMTEGGRMGQMGGQDKTKSVIKPFEVFDTKTSF